MFESVNTLTHTQTHRCRLDWYTILAHHGELKMQTKRPKLRLFYQNDANGIANSEDPDQNAPLGAV